MKKNKKIKKEFSHRLVEICNICGKEIYTDEDLWATIIDYDAEEQTGIAFYHRNCLIDLIKGKVSILENKWKEKMSEMVVNILGKAKERGLIPS